MIFFLFHPDKNIIGFFQCPSCHQVVPGKKGEEPSKIILKRHGNPGADCGRKLVDAANAKRYDKKVLIEMTRQKLSLPE
jgi:hypothetical protein